MRTTPPPPIDITQVFPELADKAKQTVRLHPRRDPEPAPHESKMGGLFLWPADEPWPVCTVTETSLTVGYSQPIDKDHLEHNDVYVGVLQLRAEGFPELPFPKGTNLFQLLWCPCSHDSETFDYAPMLKTYWRKSEEITNPIGQAPLPKYPDESYLLQPCTLQPERVIEYPSTYDFDDPSEFLTKLSEWDENNDQAGLYEEQLSVAPGTKLGGYIDWIQSFYVPVCEQQHEMEHLLTIASWEYDGIAVPNSLWLPVEDYAEVQEQFDGRSPIRNPAGIMLGDAGLIYVFICRKCDHWPIDWEFQSS